METDVASCSTTDVVASCSTTDVMTADYFQLPLNVDRVCRICLTENENLASIFDESRDDSTLELPRKIRLCGTISVDEEDGLPSLICEVCIYKANLAYDFRQTCLHSDEKLRLLYNKPASCSIIENGTQTDSQTRIILTKASENGSQNIYFVKEEQPMQNLNAQITEVYAESIAPEFKDEDEKLYVCNIGLDEVSKSIQIENIVEGAAAEAIVAESNKQGMMIYSDNGEKCLLPPKRTSSRKTKSLQTQVEYSDDEDFFDQGNDNFEPDEKRFRCKSCPKQYATHKGLKKHALVHEKKFQCEICSKVFQAQENLEAHQKTHEMEVPDESSLENHGTDVAASRSDNEDGEGEGEGEKQLHKCERCGQCCSTLKNLKRHSLIHGIKKYSCTVCQKLFFRADTLKKHAERHGHGLLDNIEDENKLYDSDEDPFRNVPEPPISRREDGNEEGATGEFKCQHCNKVMATKKGLRRHVSMHKPKAEPVSCEICRKVCASQARLALHQKTHNKPKERPPREYLCHMCSKVYPSNSSLTYHMRTHTGVKPHVCKICNSGFTTTTSLANHIRIHTGDKPFVCHVCSAAFAVSSAFRRHLTRHTGEANYLCKTCGKAFKRLSTLKEHTYTHSGEKPYVCKTCGAAYSHSGSLFAHQKRCRAQYTDVIVEEHRSTVLPQIQVVSNMQTAVAMIGQMF